MFVFCDLETTGLNALKDKILEVGILVMEDDLTTEKAYFRQCTRFLAYKDGEPRPDLDPFVVDMHEKNRLWYDCSNSYMTSYAVEKKAVEFMEPYKGEPLCGSTISFDRAFLQANMPVLEKCFHYRNVDVSSVGILMNKLGVPRPEKREAHRALADCRESAANLRYYMDFMDLAAAAWRDRYGRAEEAV